jgi:hypothetical protein
VAYLELSPYQAHTVWAVQAAGVELWGERYGAGSEPLPPLDRLDIGQVNVEQLDAPAPGAEGSGEAGLPGAGAAIPGGRP